MVQRPSRHAVGMMLGVFGFLILVLLSGTSFRGTPRSGEESGPLLRSSAIEPARLVDFPWDDPRVLILTLSFGGAKCQEQYLPFPAICVPCETRSRRARCALDALQLSALGQTAQYVIVAEDPVIFGKMPASSIAGMLKVYGAKILTAAQRLEEPFFRKAGLKYKQDIANFDTYPNVKVILGNRQDMVSLMERTTLKWLELKLGIHLHLGGAGVFQGNEIQKAGLWKGGIELEPEERYSLGDLVDLLFLEDINANYGDLQIENNRAALFSAIDLVLFPCDVESLQYFVPTDAVDYCHGRIKTLHDLGVRPTPIDPYNDQFCMFVEQPTLIHSWLPGSVIQEPCDDMFEVVGCEIYLRTYMYSGKVLWLQSPLLAIYGHPIMLEETIEPLRRNLQACSSPHHYLEFHPVN